MKRNLRDTAKEIKEQEIMNLFVEGGIAIGLGTSRGMYGKFEVAKCMKVTNNEELITLIQGINTLKFTVTGINIEEDKQMALRVTPMVKASRASKTPKAARKPRKPKPESPPEPETHIPF